MTGDTKARAHVFVKGLVQGVYFRANTRDTARHLGLTGWVRNLPDGRVETVFEGDRGDVDEMIRWCGKGPDAARVDKIDIQREAYKGEFMDFSIIH